MNTRTDGMSCMHLFPNILAILIYLSKMFYKLILIQLVDVICIYNFLHNESKLNASQPEYPVVCLSILDEFEYKNYDG